MPSVVTHQFVGTPETYYSGRSTGDYSWDVMSAPSASLPPISTRRRACTACQQAKRRCDQRLPRCGRCVQKGLADCHYPSLEATVAAADFNFFTDILSGVTTSTPTALPTPHQQQPLDHIPTSLGGHPIPPEPATYWQLPPPFYSPSDSPSNLHASVARDAIQYSTEHFRAYPRRWVAQNGCLSFIHPALYLSPPSHGGSVMADGQLPLVLQDCFCACAAYAAKNDENADLIMSIVESKATALLASFAYNDNTWALTDQVAALQALVMYQMIRWFDGDIRQRVLADAVEPILVAWTSALQNRVGSSVFNTSHTPDGTSNAPPSPPSAAYTGQSTPPFPASGPFFTPYEQAGGQQQQQQQQPPSHVPAVIEFASVSSGATGSPRVGTPTRSASTTPTSSRSMTKEDLRLAWRRWLLAESIRRVVIASHLVREVYATARQGSGLGGGGGSSSSSWSGSVPGFSSGQRGGSPSSGGPGCPLQDMSFTAAARLWSSSTPEQWRRAVGETSFGGAGAGGGGGWWWVERMDFSGVFASTDPREVDEFALLAGVVVRGREMVEDWLAQAGRGRRI